MLCLIRRVFFFKKIKKNCDHFLKNSSIKIRRKNETLCKMKYAAQFDSPLIQVDPMIIFISRCTRVMCGDNKK